MTRLIFTTLGVGLLVSVVAVKAVTENDCYMKSCDISLSIRDNTNTILANSGGARSSNTMVIAASEEAMKEHAMLEINQMGTKSEQDLDSSAGVVNQALDAAKAEILADIASVCPSNEFKLTDVQSLFIELDVYSGVPNPTWTVGSGTGDFDAIVAMLAKATSTQLPNVAGYRGFIVNVDMMNGASLVYRFGVGQEPTLEIALLNSKSGLDAALVSVVTAGINGQQPPDLGFTGPLAYFQLPLFDVACGKARECTEPTFGSGSWSGLAVFSNNCFNYAFNYPTNTLAQPGRKVGLMYSSLTGLEVRNAAVQDRLMDVNDTDPGVFPDIFNCLTALVIMENLDFHFLRQDSSGLWSHKIGTNEPTNVDNSGNSITDPRTADLGPYKFVRFIGYCERYLNKYGIE